MIYVKNAVETLCTRRAQSKTPSKVYKTPKCLQMKSTLKNSESKILMHTHTHERVCPPIIITINKRCIHSFHPQKRNALHFLQKTEDMSFLVLENTIVPVFPYLPNSSKPNTCKERLCTPGKPAIKQN